MISGLYNTKDYSNDYWVMTPENSVLPSLESYILKYVHIEIGYFTILLSLLYF